MSLRKITAAFLFVLFSFSFISSQISSRNNKPLGANISQPNPQDTKPDIESEQKATALLEKIVEQSQALRLAENRIYIKTIAADILWTRDEKRARSIYEDAAKEFTLALNDIESDEEGYQQRVQWLIQARSTIIEKLAPRDPEMALAFLRSTRQPMQEASSQYYGYGYDAESQLEARLTNLIATKDPKLALRVALENLKKGFQYEIVSTLQNLRSKDKESYNTLLKEILSKLKGENLTVNQYAANVALSLLSTLRSQKEDEEAYKELILFLVSVGAKATNRTTNPNNVYSVRNLLSSLQSYAEDVEKYAPSQIAAIKKNFADTGEALDPYSREMEKLNRLSQNGTIENILEAAQKVPQEYRQQFYSTAVWKAVGDGNLERASQIAESADMNSLQKKQLLEQISRQRINKIISESKVDEARQFLPSVKNVQEAVQMYIQLATNISIKGDKEKALEILQEASGLINRQPKNYTEIYSKLQLTRAFAQYKPERSFELLASIPPQLNELVAAASALSGFENNYLRDGEWQILNAGGSISGAVNECQQQIAELARKDFERAVAMTETFGRDEIRLKGLLLIAQMTLGKNN